MRKKTTVILLVLAIFASMCTGCIKRYYEESEAEEMAELGESIVQEYLDENNIDATITLCEATIYGVPVLYLTSYANGTIEEDGVSYEFYVDTETRQIYTGKYSEELRTAIKNKFYESIGVDEQDIVSIKTSEYGLVLPTKWGNENKPKGEVIISACVAPIEVTDVAEYLASDDALMLNVTFDGTVKDDVDLSFLKNTDYRNTFAAKNIMPFNISIGNISFRGHIGTKNMFYSEYDFMDYEDLKIRVLIHEFDKYDDDIEDYVFDIDDVSIDKNGNEYNFSLKKRYNSEFANTRLTFFYEGDNPPEITYTYTRNKKEVTGKCSWDVHSDGVWCMKSEDNNRVFSSSSFTLSR